MAAGSPAPQAAAHRLRWPENASAIPGLSPGRRPPLRVKGSAGTGPSAGRACRHVPLQNAVTGLTCASLSRLRGPAVLVDHAAEYLPALHRRVQRRDGRLVMIGWPLIPGLVRPVPVIVPGVGPQYHPQVGLVVDQHPVGALRPDGPYPALGIAIVPHRQLHPIQMIGTAGSG